MCVYLPMLIDSRIFPHRCALTASNSKKVSTFFDQNIGILDCYSLFLKMENPRGMNNNDSLVWPLRIENSARLTHFEIKKMPFLANIYMPSLKGTSAYFYIIILWVCSCWSELYMASQSLALFFYLLSFILYLLSYIFYLISFISLYFGVQLLIRALYGITIFDRDKLPMW